ncbi:MAG: glutamine amidotransferase [Blautia sp.]|nr:glutamine amidotransferase [Blautia sp.]
MNAEKKIRICHLYPDVLNLYGDRGNIICMKKRLVWRGIECEVTEAGIGDCPDLTQFDLFFIGGGQDFEQEVLLEDLKAGKGKEIRSAVEDGKTFLCICGGYQMMGHYYQTHDGVRCEFLGAIDLFTTGAEKRMIGNYAFTLTEDLGSSMVVGFENHSGQTWLGSGVSPLGTVLQGNGNNGVDRTEGVHYKNVFGTYSHGPVLPKNPEFCDRILLSALERRYGNAVLEPLDDSFERSARDSIQREMKIR